MQVHRRAFHGSLPELFDMPAGFRRPIELGSWKAREGYQNMIGIVSNNHRLQDLRNIKANRMYNLALAATSSKNNFIMIDFGLRGRRYQCMGISTS